MSACSLTYCHRWLPSIAAYALPLAGRGQPIYTGGDADLAGCSPRWPVCPAALARQKPVHSTTVATAPTDHDIALVVRMCKLRVCRRRRVQPARAPEVAIDATVRESNCLVSG